MKLTTQQIKQLIPGWLTPDEIERLRQNFIPPMDPGMFYKQTANPKYWARESKTREGNNREYWYREFDNRLFDSQLRCYVWTDEADEHVIKHDFITE